MRRSLLLSSRIATTAIATPLRRIHPSTFRHPAVILSTLPRFNSSALAVPTTSHEDVESTTTTASSPYSSSKPTLAGLRTAQGPLVRYDSLVEAGTLLNDDFQRIIVSKLQTLHDELEGYSPPPVAEEVPTSGAGGGGFLSRLFHSSSPSKSPSSTDSNTLTIPSSAPKGLYLHGSVGTGKSMLMDLFHSTLPQQFHSSRRRVHFHAFMIDVHKRNHAYKLKYGESGDRMGEVARDLAKEARVLSFDEFQVTDITDAMILRNLLERLMGYGVVCVMTSNRHPDDLYKNGLQRASFLPCIQLIKDRFEVTDLNGEDYRRVPGAVKKVYFSSSDPVERDEFRKMFESHTARGTIVYNRKIDVWGRQLTVPESTQNVAWFTFDDLCGKNLGAADYLEVTKKFGTVFLEGIPKMNLDSKDRVRRFITFMDACYESRTKLFLSSEAPLMDIFADDDPERAEIADGARGIMDDLGVKAGKNEVPTAMFSGEEEVFAFKRCGSRLAEMGGERWASFSAASTDEEADR
ncbi:AFG1-like ATPase-domain-containing protein [Mrakia frigida]|uniref:AFG1 family ATPase n=1 Tax=Mrakia frigida TaxID=29902 RepID=UPI003FCC0AD9